MPKRPIIYFSRHGLTDWNIIRRIQGQVDRDITEVGRAQAARNGRLLKELIGDANGFDFVASPLRRTRETMEIIRQSMGLDPAVYRLDSQLMELNFGEWQGFTEDEIAVEHPELIAHRIADKWNFMPPGDKAESYSVLAKRIGAWVEQVKEKTVCVTHGGCLRAVLHLYGDMSEAEAANASIEQDRILRFDENGLEWL